VRLLTVPPRRGGNSAPRPFVGVTVRRTRNTLALVLALAVVAAACAAPSESGGAADVSVSGQGPYRGTEVEGRYTLPSVELTDTRGEGFDLASDTEAPVTLLFFGYTSCPDVCNVVLANVASALRRAEPGVRQDVQMVFVTSDPARDTPEVIREYLDRFDPSFVGLTGRMPPLKKVAKQVGVALTGKVETSGGYEVGHGTQMIAFGRDERSDVLWTAGTPVDDLRRDVTALVRKAR
jgi:protein SCO1